MARSRNVFRKIGPDKGVAKIVRANGEVDQAEDQTGDSPIGVVDRGDDDKQCEQQGVQEEDKDQEPSIARFDAALLIFCNILSIGSACLVYHDDHPWGYRSPSILQAP